MSDQKQPQEYKNPYLPSLDVLARQIAEFWKEHDKPLYRELVRSKKLDQFAQRQAEQTYRHAQTLQQQGVDQVTASSEAMREIAHEIIK